MTRRLFLDKGLELFEEKGFAATTVDDISAAVGTTRATFYSHFPSKAQLMRSLVERSNEMLTEADVPPLHSVVESGDRELIRVWLARKFDQWADIRPYVVAAHQAAASEPDIQAALDQWFDTAIDDMQAITPATARRASSTESNSLSCGAAEDCVVVDRWVAEDCGLAAQPVRHIITPITAMATVPLRLPSSVIDTPSPRRLVQPSLHTTVVAHRKRTDLKELHAEVPVPNGTGTSSKSQPIVGR